MRILYTGVAGIARFAAREHQEAAMPEQDRLRDLVDLYEELEQYRQRRYQLLMYLAYYGVGLLLTFGVTRLARMSFAMAVIGFVLVVVLGVVVGLVLLSRFIQNEIERRELEQEIGRIRREEGMPTQGGQKKKRKRKRRKSYFVVGDDGELIEDDAPDAERPSRQRRAGG
jgi:hypothetical protein